VTHYTHFHYPSLALPSYWTLMVHMPATSTSYNEHLCSAWSFTAHVIIKAIYHVSTQSKIENQYVWISLLTWQLITEQLEQTLISHLVCLWSVFNWTQCSFTILLQQCEKCHQCYWHWYHENTHSSYSSFTCPYSQSDVYQVHIKSYSPCFLKTQMLAVIYVKLKPQGIWWRENVGQSTFFTGKILKRNWFYFKMISITC
jgi:hypothetical protein